MPACWLWSPLELCCINLTEFMDGLDKDLSDPVLCKRMLPSVSCGGRLTPHLTDRSPSGEGHSMGCFTYLKCLFLDCDGSLLFNKLPDFSVAEGCAS